MSGPGEARVVVLDDDPLGGQCVRDVPVLTTWSPNALTAELERSPAFLLLANTRALSRPEAIDRAREIGAALREAERTTGLSITPVWRSDSTLRGHFCWEMHAFDAVFRGDEPARPVCVFLPYFGEAGRITIHDTQYVAADGGLVPVHETEFARDPAFAFEHSHRPSWLEAHSGGQHHAANIASVSLNDLRTGGVARVTPVLGGAPAGSAVIVNATTDDDLATFVRALKQTSAGGARFLCTGAAPFIRALLGQEKHPLLTAAEMGLTGDMGGLSVVGSYVDKTTAQLERLPAEQGVTGFELDAGALGDGSQGTKEYARIAALISKYLASGEDVVLHTTRTHVDGAAPAIAAALSAIVAGLDVRPRYLLVKGGSTASALATGALGVRRAVVLGQLLAGVPVWRLSHESRWPGLPFVIFAGNVGTEESLSEALRALRRDRVLRQAQDERK